MFVCTGRGFTVTLSTNPVGANQTPPANSVLVAIPVTAARISLSAPVVFQNGSCNQSFLTTGRNSIYLTAVWTDQHGHQPSQLVQAIEALAGVAAPLAGLVAPGASSLLRLDTGVASSMTTPYAKLLGTIDTLSTATKTTAPLKEGTYFVSTPGGRVSIAICRIQSIQEAFNIPQIKNAFDTSLQSLSGQVSKDPTTCIQIGRNLELFQNLSRADAVYALARIVAASGIDGGKAASCLGSVYGPQVAQNDYWKKHSEIKFPDEAFLYLDTMNPTTYSAIRFAEIVAALNDYAEGKGNKALLDEYFSPQVQIKDRAGPGNLDGAVGGVSA